MLGQCPMFQTLFHRAILLVLMVVAIALADQITKKWAEKNLAYEFAPGQFYPQKDIPVVRNFFNLIYKENSAAAFSITSSVPDWFRKPFLLTVSILATLFFLVWYFRLKNPDNLILISFCLVMGGAIGNLIDRFRMGYVIDFLDFYASFI